MPYIGDVLIDVIKDESLSESSSTTDHALEDGEQITDHIEHDPITLNLTGLIVDPGDEKLLKLRKYRQDGKILSYNYRTRLETVVITSFDSDKSKDIRDGYVFTMTLKQIRLSKRAEVIRVTKPTEKQVKAVSNEGKKTVKPAAAKTPPKNPTTTPKPAVPRSPVRDVTPANVRRGVS